ncbi:antibiotic biosynthesis monooxygenase [Glaciimonas sp. CA11.2]|uniref:antibiotic biosynthesis monooxygenase family protein n=1 Tax=unclassified Glaciimonas TaxID=2644401 RepID=UPI002AB59D35|nr:MULTISPECIES: antibiotic biosynthesis monooxygenase [unclassified Glaciimonas]MDY7544934.1 antibiotic biosynthesis monooxygenase [Glaciimonas sp. CA11.2]MEB0013237.1 antibiotic biosynthesis monooxygenase [Glaciimonas sp. Cout2]MEB0082522.1 antibiotic biosynthesis monooxygenase [Glaciimonas sp. Gout2]MEB0163045.1 antibiotic biosynthesis monooxygenase [Glaciimonas sp. CA11.2]
MILNAATLDIIPGQEAAFEAAFAEAKKLIMSTPGYISHALQRCVELPNRYILLVHWQTLEHHTIGFMQSFQYQEWRTLMQHFYKPPPILHYAPVGRKIYRGF